MWSTIASIKKNHDRFITREDFLNLDHQDPLALFRNEFHIPQGVIYMDVWNAVNILADIMADEIWKDPKKEMEAWLDSLYQRII